MTTILAIGDIVGKAGRISLEKLLPVAKAKFKPDLVILNGENSAGGFGLTKKIYDKYMSLGVDGITMGNHWHDKREIHDYLPQVDNLVIPANMSNVDSESSGLRIIKSQTGVRFALINLIGTVFMKPGNKCPFLTADRLLKHIPESIKTIIVDIHAEATSEKQALGHYLDGRVSLVYGTHSHVPTADCRIFTNGTGFITDLGLSGSYDSVIGIRKEAAILRILTGQRKKFEPAKKDIWLSFIIAKVDENAGCCAKIEHMRWPVEE